MSYLKHGNYDVTIFVSSSSKNASSTATGVSPDEPVTLERAVELANLYADGESVLVLLGSGTYSLDNPITFTGTNVALAAMDQGTTGTSKTEGSVSISKKIVYDPASPGVFAVYGLRVISNKSFALQGETKRARFEGCVAGILQVNIETQTVEVYIDRCILSEIHYGDFIGGGGSLEINESSISTFQMVLGGLGVGGTLDFMTVRDSFISTFLVYTGSNLSDLRLTNSTIADFTTQSTATMDLTAHQSTIQTFDVVDLIGGTWRFTDCDLGDLGLPDTQNLSTLRWGLPAAVETWFDNTLVAVNGEILPYNPQYANGSAENISKWPRFSGAIIEAPSDDTASITHLFGARQAEGGLVRTVDAADFLRHVSASFSVEVSPGIGVVPFGVNIPPGSYMFACQVGILVAGAATAFVAVQDSAATTLLPATPLNVQGSFGGLQVAALAAGQLQLAYTGVGATGTVFVIVRYVTI